MNIKQIKALAQILAQNDLSALEINEGETHIRLERTVAQSAAQAGAVLVAPPMPAAAAQSAQEAPASAPVPEPVAAASNVRPTAIPSGMLWSVTASTSMVVLRMRARRPSGLSLPICICGRSLSQRSKYNTPRRNPPPTGKRMFFPSASN